MQRPPEHLESVVCVAGEMPWLSKHFKIFMFDEPSSFEIGTMPKHFRIALGWLEHGLHEPTIWIGLILFSGPRLHLQLQVHGSLRPNGHSNVIGHFGYFWWGMPCG